MVFPDSWQCPSCKTNITNSVYCTHCAYEPVKQSTPVIPEISELVKPRKSKRFLVLGIVIALGLISASVILLWPSIQSLFTEDSLPVTSSNALVTPVLLNNPSEGNYVVGLSASNFNVTVKSYDVVGHSVLSQFFQLYNLCSKDEASLTPDELFSRNYSCQGFMSVLNYKGFNGFVSVMSVNSMGGLLYSDVSRLVYACIYNHDVRLINSSVLLEEAIGKIRLVCEWAVDNLSPPENVTLEGSPVINDTSGEDVPVLEGSEPASFGLFYSVSHKAGNYIIFSFTDGSNPDELVGFDFVTARDLFTSCPGNPSSGSCTDYVDAFSYKGVNGAVINMNTYLTAVLFDGSKIITCMSDSKTGFSRALGVLDIELVKLTEACAWGMDNLDI